MPKKENIEKLFDNIAPSYDRLNHLLSLDVDRSWRRRAVKSAVDDAGPLRILDIACGTADLTIALARRLRKIAAETAGTAPPDNPFPGHVTGVDISEKMMEIGRRKIAAAGLDATIDLRKGDGENLPFGDNCLERVTCAFGIRNFEHISLGLKEMRRVLVPGGKAVILELSIPRNPLAARLYKFYFTGILPAIGGKASGDRASYSYLPASVLKFPDPETFLAMLRDEGFIDVRHRSLSLGICRMYTAVK